MFTKLPIVYLEELTHIRSSKILTQTVRCKYKNVFKFLRNTLIKCKKKIRTRIGTG